LPVRRPISKATILWIDSSTTSLHDEGGWPLHRNDVRRGHCGYTAEEECGKITGQIRSTGNIERVARAVYGRNRSGLSMYTSRRSDRFYASIWSVKTAYMRSRARASSWWRPRCLGMAKRLQDDPEMKEMINAMDPVVRRFRDESMVCIQENPLKL
jgi:hypothetical protein